MGRRKWRVGTRVGDRVGMGRGGRGGDLSLVSEGIEVGGSHRSIRERRKKFGRRAREPKTGGGGAKGLVEETSNRLNIFVGSKGMELTARVRVGSDSVVGKRGERKDNEGLGRGINEAKAMERIRGRVKLVKPGKGFGAVMEEGGPEELAMEIVGKRVGRP